MRAHIPGRYAALALLLGGLACASNKANTDEGSVVAQDSTKANNDTVGLQGPAARHDGGSYGHDACRADSDPDRYDAGCPGSDADPGRYDAVPAAGRADPD